LETGRREIGCICGKTSSPWFHPRLQGYLDALHEYGLDFDPDRLKITSGNREEDMEAAKELLSGRKRVDAIVCANDGRALHVLEYCCERGIRLPSDLALTGFDNVHESELCQPSLTTMDPRIRSLAKEALAVLNQRRSGGLREPVIRLVEPEIMLRQSA
jgi:LacI family repressor for deo operon, udp, cdd, tsx, nupC, and nupG